ncbi:hypothetical protein PR003_g21939 [Phytophthora rubi]|uniref:Uncharacterized protein n=1 Tax=Phytophthora rubi TaxID=129364 RepID=A0A6A4D9V6_9STRA|nr:hypothetical protein PR003_g21939 [Phytophthora rubi]
MFCGSRRRFCFLCAGRGGSPLPGFTNLTRSAVSTLVVGWRRLTRHTSKLPALESSLSAVRMPYSSTSHLVQSSAASSSIVGSTRQ